MKGAYTMTHTLVHSFMVMIQNINSLYTVIYMSLAAHNILYIFTKYNNTCITDAAVNTVNCYL